MHVVQAGSSYWDRLFQVNRSFRIFSTMTKPRKMPAPWALKEIPGGYCVVDAEGKRLAYVYGLDPKELAAAGPLRLTKDEARRIASNIAKLPDLLSSEE